MEKRTAMEWWTYLTQLSEETEWNQSWLEGFVCGLANAGAITEQEEDELMNRIVYRCR